jgi:hypothetical protein
MITTFTVHRVLKSGKLSQEPSTPFGQLSPVLTQEAAEAHAANMMKMNPGSTYQAVPSSQPLPDQDQLRRDQARATQARRGARFLAQKFI